jgi:hypothetical protein
MLQFSRRTILKLSVVAILLLTRVKMTLATPLNFPFEENKPLQGNLTLRALLDTLIPADETPSALEVGVLEKITEKAAAEPQYERMIRDGCLWLDMKAREQGSSSFANLAESDRDAVLVRAASASRNSPAYLFFASIRYEAFYYYYGEPATWNMLNYPGPPQPDGFRDYVLPPTRKLL